MIEKADARADLADFIRDLHRLPMGMTAALTGEKVRGSVVARATHRCASE